MTTTSPAVSPTVLARLAAELDGRGASGDAKNLMRGRVIVVVVENAVAPGVGPAVLGENALEGCGRIIRVGRHGALAHHQRQPAVGTCPSSSKMKVSVLSGAL
jgi:hypothetical protein